MLWVAMMAARPEALTSCDKRAEDVLGGVQVEISGRLVGQQDAGRIGDCARNRHALLLAAGQLRRPVIEASAQAQIVEELDRPRFGLRHG